MTMKVKVNGQVIDLNKNTPKPILLRIRDRIHMEMEVIILQIKQNECDGNPRGDAWQEKAREAIAIKDRSVSEIDRGLGDYQPVEKPEGLGEVFIDLARSFLNEETFGFLYRESVDVLGYTRREGR